MPQFRIREVADLVGVSDDTVRRWVEAGDLQHGIDASGRKAVDGEVLAAFVRGHVSAPADPSQVRPRPETASSES